MAPADGLGALEVSVARHDVIDFALGTGSDELEEASEFVVDLAELIAEPHSHVADDLLVTATASVKLAGNVLTNNLAQSALVGSVDVLLDMGVRGDPWVYAIDTTHIDARDNVEGSSLPLLLDLLKTLFKLLELVLGDDSVLGIGAGKGDAAENVLLVEDTIEEDALVVLDHQRVEAA